MIVTVFIMIGPLAAPALAEADVDLTIPYSATATDLDGRISPGEYALGIEPPGLPFQSTLNIHHDGAYLHIGWEVPAAGWVGLGFREDPLSPFFGMQGADLIMFSNGSVTDLLGLSGNLTVPLVADVDDGGTEDIRYWAEEHGADRWIIEFLYPLWTADPEHDARLDPGGGPYLMLFAINQVDPDSSAYHGMDRTTLIFDLAPVPWGSAGAGAGGGSGSRSVGWFLLSIAFLIGIATAALIWIVTAVMLGRR